MKVENKQDAARKNAKRTSMKVRCGGVEYIDAATNEKNSAGSAENKNDNDEGKK